jgi:hypothetical protein
MPAALDRRRICEDLWLKTVKFHYIRALLPPKGAVLYLDFRPREIHQSLFWGLIHITFWLFDAELPLTGIGVFSYIKCRSGGPSWKHLKKDSQ